MPRAWRGSSTSDASTSTRTRCAPRTSITPTSCASTSTRCRASTGRRSSMSRMVAREVLDDVGLVGWPKTSGSRGLHILVRIAPQWDFKQVRLAAETLAREVENRAPGLATARWWKEERGESVFVDFNQNAKDRTVASAYSIRPLPDARVSTPLDWDEVRRAPARGVHGAHRARAIRRDRRPARGHRRRRRDRSTGCSALAKELGPAEKPPRGRRRVDGRRAVDDAAHRDRAHQDQARGARGARAVEGAASRRRRAAAPRRHARRRHARLEFALVPRAGQPAARAGGVAPAAGASCSPTTTRGPARPGPGSRSADALRVHSAGAARSIGPAGPLLRGVARRWLEKSCVCTPRAAPLVMPYSG